MGKCKCGGRTRIVSDVVQSLDGHGKYCRDVCASPICKDPHILGIMAPLIYDEVGINLCASITVTPAIATTYPTATSATVKVVDATYTYGDGNVEINSITGRQSCYNITLSNIGVQLAINLYDASCRYLGTIYQTVTYLPADTTAPTYDEDTNPTSVELQLFAPYGLSYTADATAPTPVINFVGANEENNTIQQGVNLFGMAKLLDLNTADSTVVVGLTLVLQSLYYVGYKVKSAGKIDIPKGSILSPEDTDCMRFVAGDLLNLAIKPLDLGKPAYEEFDKQECCDNKCGNRSCPGMGTRECNGPCTLGIVDDEAQVTTAPTT